MTAIAALLAALCGPAWGMTLEITSDPPLPAPNLIQNPGIEEGKDGQPDHWRWSTAVVENFVIVWADNGRAGRCLYLKAHSGIMSGYWNQSVRVEPRTEYVMTGWFRISGGKILCYAHAKAPDGRGIDQRFYASSNRNHFLVPVFLKPEYMAGMDAENWHPIRLPFTTIENMEWVAVSLGMYFTAGEVWYDDISVFRATTDLSVKVNGNGQELSRVRVLAKGAQQPVFDSEALPAGTRTFERSIPAASTENHYVLEVTTSDGKVQLKSYPEEVAQ